MTARSSKDSNGTDLLTVFGVFLRLGLTSFGGPIAHLGYFRTEFVERRRWLSEPAYADIVALCQFLPGPASSQVGMAVGMMRAGLPGAMVAWLGFTAPSAIIMIVFGYGLLNAGDLQQPWLHGLKVVAVSIVAQAIWGMARNLCPDRERITLAAAAAVIALAVPTAIGQVGTIVLGGVVGLALQRTPLPAGTAATFPLSHGGATGVLFLAIFLGILIGLPMVVAASGSPVMAMIDSFYRAGSLVFGGGHVVLPLLQHKVVTPGWVDNDLFLAGYGAAQAVPGPLFTFAAFLGTVMKGPAGGWIGGCICLLAIFLPSFLLVAGFMPFWNRWRLVPRMQAAMAGVNAAVVGLLLAAFYSPVWTSGIGRWQDAALALAAFVLLQFWRVPPWMVVALCAATSGLLPLLAAR